MNPDKIRSWILACGKQFGINDAFEYRWPGGARERPDVMFCTYRIQGSVPEGDEIISLTEASGYNGVEKASQSYLTTVVIDLYNSQNGIHELNSFCVAFKHHPSILALFEEHAALYDQETEDQTDYDDEEIRYHQRLTCVFRESVAHTLTETNTVVETIRAQVDDGTYHDQYDITSGGITPTT